MTDHVPVAHRPKDEVDEIVERARLRFGHAPGDIVLDERGKPIGIFSNRNKIEPALLAKSHERVETDENGLVRGFDDHSKQDIEMMEWARDHIRHSILIPRLRRAMQTRTAIAAPESAAGELPEPPKQIKENADGS